MSIETVRHRSRLHAEWLRVFVSLAAGSAILALLLLPSIALGLTTSQTRAAAHAQSYNLGEQVVTDAAISFANTEKAAFQSVKYQVTGPQAVSPITLPLGGGLGQDLTALLPKDNSNPQKALGALSVDVTLTDLQGGDIGFGYGYGYTGLSALGKLAFLISYTPPIKLYPPPVDLPNGFGSPSPGFPVPGGQQQQNAATTINVNFKFGVPFVPGASFTALDIACCNTFGDLLILLDGNDPNATPANEDMVAEVSPNDGFLFNFFGTGEANATSVAINPNNNDVYLGVVQGTDRKFKKIIGDVTITVTDAGTNDLTAMVFDVPNNKVPASVFQTDPNKNIDIFSVSATITGGVSKISAPAGPTGGGYTGLAINTTVQNNPPFLAGYGNLISEVQSGNGLITQTIPVTNQSNATIPVAIDGLAVVGNSDIYVADAGSGSILSGSLFTAQAAATNFVKAIAQHNGGHAFVLVSPSTIHYVQTSDGTSLQNFGTPNNNSGAVEGLAYIGGTTNLLFAIDNDTQRKLYKAAVTGSGATANIGAWSLVKALPTNLVGNIGAMASKDNPTLYAGEQNSQKVHILDTSGNVTGTMQITSQQGFQGFVPGGVNAMAFVPAAKNPAANGGDLLIIGDGNHFFRVNAVHNPAASPPKIGGNILNVDGTGGNPPYFMRGMTADATTGIILAADEPTNQVYKTVVPGTPATEKTAIGSYTAKLIVDVTNQTDPSDANVAFDLAKLTDLGLAITKVGTIDVTGQTDPTVGVTGASVAVEGLVLDATVSKVSVQGELAEVILVGKPGSAPTGPSDFETSADRDQYVENGLWKIVNNIAGVITNNYVLYFGKNETTSPNFCNPNCQAPPFLQLASVGSVDSATFTAGTAGEITFDTEYQTEGQPEFDKKLVLFCETNVTPCTKIAQFVDPFAIFVPGFDPNTIAQGTVVTKPGTSDKFVMLSSGLGVLKPIKLALPGSVSGKIGTLTFKFDSGDGFGNEGHGWIIDNVQVKGQGSQSLADATVGADLKWSLTVLNVAEGTSVINLSASRSAYDPITDTAKLTLIRDTAPPVVDTLVVKSLDATQQEVTITDSVTRFPSIRISGTFTESTPQELNVYLNNKSVLKKTSFSNDFTIDTTLATANAGLNTIAVVVKDQAGQCNTTNVDKTTCTAAESDKTLTLTLDNTPTTITTLTTQYPIGFTSVRSGAGREDFAVFQLNVSDNVANGVATVKGATPGQSSYDISFRSDIPTIVKNQWNATGGWVLPFKPPTTTVPGKLTLSIQVTDKAGNTANGTLEATVTAALQGFTIYMLPGSNFASLPIIPDRATFNPTAVQSTTGLSALEAFISGQTVGATAVPGLVDGALSPVDNLQAIDQILYYDATLTGATGTTTYEADPSLRWKVWTAAPTDTDSLTKASTGRGYLFQMRSGAFAAGVELAPGLPPAPSPIRVSYAGTFLPAGQAVPPLYQVEGGSTSADGAWNMMGYHAEDTLSVTVYLQSLAAPSRTYASVLEYRNFINFPLAAGATPQVVLGTFTRLLDSDSFTLGRGFWLFATADGIVVP